MTSEEAKAAAALGPISDEAVQKVAHLLNTAPRTRSRRKPPTGPPPNLAQVADEMRAAHAALGRYIEQNPCPPTETAPPPGEGRGGRHSNQRPKDGTAR